MTPQECHRKENQSFGLPSGIPRVNKCLLRIEWSSSDYSCGMLHSCNLEGILKIMWMTNNIWCWRIRWNIPTSQTWEKTPSLDSGNLCEEWECDIILLWFRCLETTAIEMWCDTSMTPTFGRDGNRNVILYDTSI